MNLDGLKDCMDSPSIKPGIKGLWILPVLNLGLRDCGSSQYYTCELMNLEGLKDCGSSQYFGSICIVWVLEMIIVFAGIIEPPEINFTLN